MSSLFSEKLFVTIVFGLIDQLPSQYTKASGRFYRGGGIVVSADKLKNTMSTWASGITVVTTLDEQRLHAMTASSFTSVSMDPPLILVCVGKKKRTHQILLDQKAFGVVVLAVEQEEISNLAAGFRGSEGNYLPGIEWEMRSGVPILKECLSWMSCSLYSTCDGGDHTIFIGKVEDTGVVSEQPPLVWYSRGYRKLSI